MSVFQTAFLCFRNTCRKPRQRRRRDIIRGCHAHRQFGRHYPARFGGIAKGGHHLCRRHARYCAALSAYGIQGRLVSVREHNERQMADKVIGFLSDGMVVAQVSDAGTLTVCDPGAKLARRVREAGFKVVPVVGASAVMAALSVVGVAESDFISTVLYRRNRANVGNCLPNGCGRHFLSSCLKRRTESGQRLPIWRNCSPNAV